MADPIERARPGLPRVVNLEGAVAAREPEVGPVGGGRATSHRRHDALRRPNAKLQQQWIIHRHISDGGGPPGAAGGGPDTSASPAPSSLGPDSSPRGPPSAAGDEGSGEEFELDADGRPTNRAMRRRPALVQAAAEASCAADPAAPGFEGPRRLETHVWHARRMAMKLSCGHLLASKAVGRGHGSRSLLQKARRGALAHDASYWCCLQLEGEEGALAGTLEAVSVPGHWRAAWETPGFREGAVEAPIVLQVPGPAFPARAVGPSMVMLHPLEPSTAPAAAPRRAWVWVHAATAREAAAALRSAAAAGGGEVAVVSLAPYLRRLELCGAGADAALAAALGAACETTICLDGAAAAGAADPDKAIGGDGEGGAASGLPPSVSGPSAARDPD
ncbi:hypothetical protein MNEG_14939 [Monoraphidium neglectum]|uniref:Pop1 N-terminal domain-containing protein n=1 Tax=Monoraphidium neglectum TaxID=145388 RepID=A0A0D2LMI3_9CHLO|nr:hypothetical protein MNEG_14939 [Monoraphidium neglectum]KIY93024.1 hypothetical protein MNEG_14939 [Monoraphidium neglectum]|eukprot:XP_013892044.1 hypothetical protein MNEG_14939 [Monoraphidium neglectum]